MPTENPRAAIGGNKPPTFTAILKDRHKKFFDDTKKLLAQLNKANANPVTEAECAIIEDLFGKARDLANDAERVRAKEKEEPLRLGNEIDALFNGEIRDALGVGQKGGLARRLLDAASARRLKITRDQQAELDKAADRARAQAEQLAQKADNAEARGNVREADKFEAQADATMDHAQHLQALAEAPVAEASRAVTGGGRSVSVNAVLTCTGVVRADLDLEALRPYFKQDVLVDAVNAALKMGAFTTLKGAAISEKAMGRVR